MRNPGLTAHCCGKYFELMSPYTELIAALLLLIAIAFVCASYRWRSPFLAVLRAVQVVADVVALPLPLSRDYPSPVLLC